MKNITIILPFLFLFPASVLRSQGIGDIDSIRRQLHLQKDESRIKSFILISRLYSSKAMPESAIVYLDKGLHLAKKVNDKRGQLDIESSIGSIYIRQGKYEEALKIFFNVISEAEKEKMPDIVAGAKSDIGYIYQAQNKLRESLRYLLEAEKVILNSKDTLEIIHFYAQLQVTSGRLGDTASCLMYSRKGFGLSDSFMLSSRFRSGMSERHIRIEMTLCYNTLNFLSKKEDIYSILIRVRKLRQLTKPLQNDFLDFSSFILLSNISYQLKQYRDVQEYADSGILLYKPGSGDYGRIRDLHFLLADASAKLGDYKKGYDALNMFRIYNDSLFNASQLEALNSVEARYESAKKEEKIVALKRQKRNQQLIAGISIAAGIIAIVLMLFIARAKRLEKRLFIAEEEARRSEMKKRILELEQTALRAQMNPHFIFNCLDSVQKYAIRNDHIGFNKYLTTFASLIRQTLENSGKQFLTFSEELKYLETYVNVELMRVNDDFDFYIYLDKEIPSDDIYIPNMILQPFVENAIIHGVRGIKAGRGQLIIRAEYEKHKMNLAVFVEDNGPGLNRTLDAAGIFGDSHVSMGSDITAKRIQLFNSSHKRSIEVDINSRPVSENGLGGTVVKVVFPIDNEPV